MVNDLTVTLFGRTGLNKSMPVKDVLAMLQDLDLLNVGELAEKAIAKKIGVAQAGRCTPGSDLVNGWEIKHGQARKVNRTTRRRAYVAGLENKHETLRVVITELLTGKLYFFKIPYSAYRYCVGSSIHFDFNSQGMPCRHRQREGVRPNFWDYEVESFDRLCE